MQSSNNCFIQNCRQGRRGNFISVSILGILIACTFLSWAAFGPKKDHHTLRQIAIIFRHGDRTPTETYRNDPYKNYQWEDGWGALTKEGMLQLYHLGTWIREQYGTVISEKFESSEVHIKSSYSDRCIMSAQALLAGLYIPKQPDRFIDDLPWRPVPVHSIPRELDKLITVKHPCLALDYALKDAYINESISTGKQLSSYFAELTRYTGQKIATITDVEFLYNTLEIEDKNNLKLPEWTKKFYNETMREIAAKSLTIFTSNTFQRRLRGGPLLKEIITNMMNARNGNEKKKMFLYSAHDITIVNVLRAMGFTNELFKPEYGAALIFELVVAEDTELDPQLDIKVKYLNHTAMKEPVSLNIPGCKEPCRFIGLSSIWYDVLPTDWDSDCRV